LQLTSIRKFITSPSTVSPIMAYPLLQFKVHLGTLHKAQLPMKLPAVLSQLISATKPLSLTLDTPISGAEMCTWEAEMDAVFVADAVAAAFEGLVAEDALV